MTFYLQRSKILNQIKTNYSLKKDGFHMEYIIFALLAIVIIPLGVAFFRAKNKKSFKKLLVTNIALFFVISVCVIVFMPMIAAADAETVSGSENEVSDTENTADANEGLRKGLGYLGAALATGMSCIGAGIAVSGAASSAIGATSENPKMFAKSMLFVALAEGVALYGMLISFQIISALA